MRQMTVLPPEDSDQMLELSRFLEQASETTTLVGPDGQAIPLPTALLSVLTEVVAAMRNGKAITVAPVDQLLTTQEAADFLGISRPTLVKLLEAGDIAFQCTSPGGHRRVRLEDVIKYQKKATQTRREALDEMVNIAVESGLYEVTAERYQDALRAARKKRGR